MLLLSESDCQRSHEPFERAPVTEYSGVGRVLPFNLQLQRPLQPTFRPGRIPRQISFAAAVCGGLNQHYQGRNGQ
jgi:hypothetical protein